jgi:cobaltochelatase CobS
MDAPKNIIHLRHPNSGNPKDWIAIPGDNCLDIYFGSTDRGITGPRQFGDTTGLTKKTIQSFRPLREQNKRAKEKLAKGYKLLLPPSDQTNSEKPSQPEPDPVPNPVALWQQGTSQSQENQHPGGTHPMNIQAPPTDGPTVQSLFHESFPPIPWPVRTTHEYEKYVPKPTKDYRFRPDITADVLGWLQFGSLSALLTGPTGAGKSSLINEIAARSNIPVFPVVGHHRLEWLDLVGQYVPNSKGTFSYELGPLPNAMKAGAILLIDELDLIDPSTLVALNSILDGRALVLSANDGEIIEPAEGFRIVGTSNSTGHGEGEADGYSGVLKMSKAFMNRLGWSFIVDYPPPETEIEIVEKIVGSRQVSEQMVSLANEVRRVHTAQEASIPDTLSTRELIQWGKAALFFRNVPRIKNPLAYALRTTVVNKASKEGQPIFKEIFQRIFNKEL